MNTFLFVTQYNKCQYYFLGHISLFAMYGRFSMICGRFNLWPF